MAEVPPGSGKWRLRYVLGGVKREEWRSSAEGLETRAEDIRREIAGAAPVAPPPPLEPPPIGSRRAAPGSPGWWGSLIQRYAARVALNPADEQAQRALRVLSAASKADLACQKAGLPDKDDANDKADEISDEQLLSELELEIASTRNRLAAKNSAAARSAAK